MKLAAMLWVLAMIYIIAVLHLSGPKTPAEDLAERDEQVKSLRSKGLL